MERFKKSRQGGFCALKQGSEKRKRHLHREFRFEKAWILWECLFPVYQGLKIGIIRQPLIKKTLIKSADKKKLTKKTRQQLEEIVEWREPDREYRVVEIADFLGIKETRARELIRELIRLEKVSAMGKNKGRRYRKKQ